MLDDLATQMERMKLKRTHVMRVRKFDTDTLEAEFETTEVRRDKKGNIIGEPKVEREEKTVRFERVHILTPEGNEHIVIVKHGNEQYGTTDYLTAWYTPKANGVWERIAVVFEPENLDWLIKTGMKRTFPDVRWTF